MKHVRLIIILCCSWLLTHFGAEAQTQLRFPQASPKSKLIQTVGLTDITIDYNRPSVRGREVWGKMVPYQQIWRTGANEVSKISFSDDIQINHEKVPAGRYAILTLPEDSVNWYVILNRDTTLWGSEGYDPALDVIRLKVSPKQHEYKETLEFSFTDIKTNTANLNLNWENQQLTLQIETEVEQKLMRTIQAALASAKPDDWLIYAQCANYMIQNDINHEQALEWINKSIEIKENFYNNWVKARLLALKREYQEAANLSRRAMQLGQTDANSYKPYASEIERAYQQWKGRR